jgi:peptidoglycan hydrolase-like protein with peptidoglycan-binding domain
MNMMDRLLVTTALATALAVSQATAQDNGGGAQVDDQQITQESSEGEGSQVYISSAGVRQVQQALNLAGYDAGNVDGTWDEDSIAAAHSFQQAENLEPTGTLTISLLYALGLESILRGESGGGENGQTAQASGAEGGSDQVDDQQITQETSEGPGTPLYVSSAGVRQVQQALNQAGYDSEAVDGVWGESTMQAALEFQQAEGIEPTGHLTVELISALGLRDQIFNESGGQEGEATASQQSGENASSQSGQQVDDQQITQEESTGQGEPLWVSSATVRQVEQALNQAGYDAGNVDGTWDDDEAQAAISYQQAENLEPTGTLTTELLASLQMGDWMDAEGGENETAGGQGASDDQQNSEATGSGNQQAQ